MAILLPTPLPIPESQRAPCELCGIDLDIREKGICQYTSGWVLQRMAGGGNAVALPERANRWAHGRCVERAARGTLGQRPLF